MSPEEEDRCLLILISKAAAGILLSHALPVKTSLTQGRRIFFILEMEAGSVKDRKADFFLFLKMQSILFICTVVQISPQ